MCTQAITKFEGKYEFLSNFSMATVIMDGVQYPTVEHAYQAAKTLDPNQRAYINKAKFAGLAKRRGRNVRIRDDWEDVKIEIMYNLLKKKFTIWPWLKKMLLDTGDVYLEEGNTWNDTVWGVCRGEGLNILGILLMLVREECRHEPPIFMCI